MVTWSKDARETLEGRHDEYPIHFAHVTRFSGYWHATCQQHKPRRTTKNIRAVNCPKCRKALARLDRMGS